MVHYKIKVAIWSQTHSLRKRLPLLFDWPFRHTAGIPFQPQLLSIQFRILTLRHVHVEMRVHVAGDMNDIPIGRVPCHQASSALGLVIHGALPVPALLAFSQLLIRCVSVSFVVNEISAAIRPHILGQFGCVCKEIQLLLQILDINLIQLMLKCNELD